MILCNFILQSPKNVTIFIPDPSTLPCIASRQRILNFVKIILASNGVIEIKKDEHTAQFYFITTHIHLFCVI